MVLEVGENMDTGVQRLVGTRIVGSVLNGIAVDQRYFIISGSRYKVAVGGAARYAFALGRKVVGIIGRAQWRGVLHHLVVFSQIVADVFREPCMSNLPGCTSFALRHGERCDPFGFF